MLAGYTHYQFIVEKGTMITFVRRFKNKDKQ